MDMTSFKSRLCFASVNYQNLFWSAFSDLPFCELDDFLKFVLCVGYLPNGIYYFDHTWPFKQHKSAVYTFHHRTLFTEYRLMFLLIEDLVIALASFNKKPVPDLFTDLCSVDFDGTEYWETFWYISYDFVIRFVPDKCSHNKSNLYCTLLLMREKIQFKFSLLHCTYVHGLETIIWAYRTQNINSMCVRIMWLHWHYAV